MTKNANQPQTVSTPGDTLSVTNYTIPASMKSKYFTKDPIIMERGGGDWF